MAFRFPFSTLHELNLDWILEKVKYLTENNEEFNTKADYAVETADEAKQIAEQAAQATIPDGAVTTIKIADGAVTGNKIASATIATSNLTAGCVTNPYILDGAVTTPKLGDYCITNNKLNSALRNLINDMIYISSETITIPSIASNAVVDGAIEITRPDGYVFLALIPSYTSSGLIIVSVYPVIVSDPTKIVLHASVYNQTSTTKTNETVSVKALWKKPIPTV